MSSFGLRKDKFIENSVFFKKKKKSFSRSKFFCLVFFYFYVCEQQIFKDGGEERVQIYNDIVELLYQFWIIDLVL